MSFDSKKFQLPSSKNVKLKKRPTLVDPLYKSKEQYLNLLLKHSKELSRLQNLHYATRDEAVLIIFQGMDAAGKDGIIKHVMSGINPQGCIVSSFKEPTALELDHDFLWRSTVKLPERGQIGIFNRSYYEEVLILKVHPKLLRGEGLRGDIHGHKSEKKFWSERYESIVDFENHLSRNKTKIIKIFLHLSYKEQTRRFLARIDDPEKNWKFSDADIKERDFWAQYQDAYEKCLEATSTEANPWHIVPADDKKNARLIVSNIILDVFHGFKMNYPKTDAKREKELQAFRRKLT